MQEKSEDMVRPGTFPPATPAKSTAMIGPSIVIKGDLYGEEDILVQGRVEGTIDVNNNKLTVGKQGVVRANIEAKSITVEGEVEGDLSGDELVVVKSTGDFKGNITAPRINLEDGCKFKGSIDMDTKASAPAPLDEASIAAAIAGKDISGGKQKTKTK